MEPKKTRRADLDSKKGIFFEIGLIIALASTLLAFQLRTHEKTIKDFDDRSFYDITEQIIPVTEHRQPPPPAVPPPVSLVVINIVENDIDVEATIIIDAEADQETEIEDYIPPEAIEIEPEEPVEEEIFYVVESMPEFPGGEAALYEYLGKNLEYPDEAREAGISGKVFVAFVVEPDGSVSNIRLLRGIGGGCDEEAIRVVENMPEWVPGRQRGKPVRVHYNLPIKFTLK